MEAKIRRSKKFIGVLFLMAVVFADASPSFAQALRIGPGDVLEISVYGQDDLATTARVNETGKITFPLIGEVSILGLTYREAEEKIAALLAEGKFVRSPQVSMFVRERRDEAGDVVTILGEVHSPGRYAVQTFTGGGADSIVAILALAGGVSENAGDYLIVARTKNDVSERRKVDLVALLQTGDMTNNISLNGGDVVLVPRTEMVYIYGEVRAPGRYRLERNMTVMQALSVAGGISERGTEKGLTITRRTETGEQSTLDVGKLHVLKADDVVNVKEGFF